LLLLLLLQLLNEIISVACVSDVEMLFAVHAAWSRNRRRHGSILSNVATSNQGRWSRRSQCYQRTT